MLRNIVGERKHHKRPPFISVFLMLKPAKLNGCAAALDSDVGE
jgi:hypothetical protein